MRLGEIIQLRVADIQTDDGIAYFDITTVLEEDDDEGDKSTKNENSVRQIPVHAMLFKIGFGEFVAARREDGSARLFPDFNQSPTDGSWSKTFSAWFRHYRRHVGVERIVRGRNRVDFHSFRHVFEDTVRDLPDVKKEWRDALQGHGEGGSSEEYGTGVYRNRLTEAMQKVAFDVDFSHLMTPARQATRWSAYISGL
jgi:integrase